MKINKIFTPLLVLSSMVSILACSSDDDTSSSNNDTNTKIWTITVEAFTLADGVYTSTGKELIFDSEEECQTWTRTAPGDNHDSSPHDHYNAAANVSYIESSTTFSWTEYGPEIDQTSIDITCSNGTGGVNKTVTNNSYFQDKPNLYLKIKSVVEK